jgi:polar amino acid transport system ATP-binding protein
MSRTEIVNVQKSFGHREILKSVDLTVESGEVVCLLGASGAGKSTLLRCINGLIMPDRGYVRVGGDLIGRKVKGGRLHDLRDREASAQRRQIGIVFQDFNLFPHLTVKGNLTLTPMTLGMLSAPNAKRKADELLAKVGLADYATAYPSELSGGQQQRVAIARALMMEPGLMLFDEPTSALDPRLTGEVLETMRGLARDGMTMIVVTHEMSFARQVADRVVLMSDGRIAEDAPPGEFFTNPTSAAGHEFLEYAERHSGD